MQKQAIYSSLLISALAVVGCDGASFKGQDGLSGAKSPSSKSSQQGAADANPAADGNQPVAMIGDTHAGSDSPSTGGASQNPSSGSGSENPGTSASQNPSTGDASKNPSTSGGSHPSTSGGSESQSSDHGGQILTAGGTSQNPGANASGQNPSACAADPTGCPNITQGGDHSPGKIGDPAGGPVVVNGGNGPHNLGKGSKDAVKKCLARWGLLSPFLMTREIPDRIIFGHLELGPANRLVDAIFGTQFSGITDETVTSKPELILIDVSLNVLATDFVLPPETYRFMNPNGWYCINFAFDIGSSVEIQLKEGAHLADPRLAINVLSDQTPIAKTNISVLSEDHVTIVP